MLTSEIAAPSVRLYPSGLKNVLKNGDIQMGFRAVFEDLANPGIGGVFTQQCQTWGDVDATYWGGVALDEFLITVGGHGKAVSVTNRALREEMAKKED